MLTVMEIRHNNVFVHDESGKEVEIIDHTLQLKDSSAINDRWQPAISYRHAGKESWREQVFVRPYIEFMQKFSLKKENVEPTENSNG